MTLKTNKQKTNTHVTKEGERADNQDEIKRKKIDTYHLQCIC